MRFDRSERVDPEQRSLTLWHTTAFAAFAAVARALRRQARSARNALGRPRPTNGEYDSNGLIAAPAVRPPQPRV